MGVGEAGFAGLFLKLWGGARKELPKVFVDTVIGALGFLLALLINKAIDQRKEIETYHSMVLAVQIEARANKTVLDTSYEQFLGEGVVIKEFTYSTAGQMLATPLFMKYTKPEDIQLLNDYIHDLALANGYRRASEPLILKGPSTFKAVSEPKGWLWSLEQSLGQMLPNIREKIARVANLGESNSEMGRPKTAP